MDASTTSKHDDDDDDVKEDKEAQEPGVCAESTALWFEFIWAGYSCRWYFWELFEVIRRIFFTAIMAFVYPDSRLQIAIALFISMIYGHVHEAVQPQLEVDEHRLATAGNGCLTLTYFITGLLRSGIGFSQSTSSATVILTIALFTPLGFTLYLKATQRGGVAI